MPLIKGGEIIDDPWIKLADDDPVPPEGSLIVSYPRWQQDSQILISRARPLGLLLASDQSPVLIADDLDHFEVIALEFPIFRDGRAFSYARLLREHMGYQKEIRAVGDVLRDQFYFMLRCGFDAFEPTKATDARDWAAAISEISLAYQPAADDHTPISFLRGKNMPKIQPKD